MSNFLRAYGPYSPWNSPGQNTRVGSLSLLQKIFLTQESNWDLLHCRQVLDQLTYQGSLQLLRVKTNSQRPWEAWPFSSWEFFWTNPSVHFSLTDLTDLSIPWLGIDASHHKLFTCWSLKWVSSIFSWPSHSWSQLSFLREAFSSHPHSCVFAHWPLWGRALSACCPLLFPGEGLAAGRCLKNAC